MLTYLIPSKLFVHKSWFVPKFWPWLCRLLRLVHGHCWYNKICAL